jgi:hypothetical protein
MRDEPVDASDSGWQFVCHAASEEDPEAASVWAINEVIEMEPSIKDYLELPPGTILVRADEHSDWTIQGPSCT